jgi:predicted nucleic acid-binding protein
MLHSSRFTAILDANVLYPAPLRDYLLRLAELELYKQKIHEEWIRNLLLNRAQLKREDLERTQSAMDSAFPDANITNYEELINSLSLPDNDDRHVLAAAIRANADIIVTFNVKDFPSDYLNMYDIEVQNPDDFITNLISLDRAKSMQAIKNQAKSLRNPPMSVDDILRRLEKCGLTNSVEILED